MNDIFSKLNNLKSIEPSESWVVDARERVLSEAPVSERKSILENIIDRKSNLGFSLQDLFQNLSFKKLAVPAFSLVFVLSAGVFTVGASKSSLPGEFLYSLKMINEDIVLAVASEDKKAEIEVEHAGKRVEEIVEISKKTSDIEQQKKLSQLMEKFDEKMSSANKRLVNTSGNGEKVKIAKTINVQSEKYTEVLVKTSEDLPAVVKDEISEEVAKAIDSSERIYLTSLAVIVEEEKEEEKEEEIIDEVIDEADEEVQDDSVEDGEETVNTEDTEKEPLDDSSDDNDNNPDNGDVLGDEDNICEIGTVDECDSEEAILDETEEEEAEGEVVKEEVEEEVVE